MKSSLKWLLLFVVIFLSCVPRIGTPTTDSFGAVYFGFRSSRSDPINLDHGMVGGTDGRLFRSTNGGSNFMQIERNIFGNDFTDIKSQNGVVAVAVGGSGTIIRTATGAASWEEVTSGTTTDLKGVRWDLGAIVVFAFGADGIILKSSDDGVTWNQQPSGTTETLLGGCFPDSSEGYLVGAGGTFLSTTNGGNTWSATPLLDSSGTAIDVSSTDLNDCHFSTTGIGHLVGGNGLLLRTTDGGATWSSISLGTPNDLARIDFTSSRDLGFLVGHSIAFRSLDEGATWEPVMFASALSIEFKGLNLLSDNSGWLVGETDNLWRCTDLGNATTDNNPPTCTKINRDF